MAKRVTLVTQNGVSTFTSGGRSVRVEGELTPEKLAFVADELECLDPADVRPGEYAAAIRKVIPVEVN